MFSGFTKKNTLFLLFGGHCIREVFQTLHDCNLALGLAIHTRSKACQNHKLFIVFLDSCPL